MNDIAVVITCHEPYLKWLHQAQESINRQMPPPVERVAVFDRCKAPPGLNSRWRILEGDWGHPSLARNAGLNTSRAPWVIFWDADNVMPEGYIAAAQRALRDAMPDLAVLYPDIQYCDEGLQPLRLWQTPTWDYWGLRATNYVDTASVWRREALEIVGGWSTRSVGTGLDYALVLDITSAGWKAAKLDGPPLLMRVHAEGRTQQQLKMGSLLTDIWRARSLAIVTLLAGREQAFRRWTNFLLNADLPPKTSLYIVDNSGRPEFSHLAFDTCQRIASVRGLTHLQFATNGQPYQGGHAEPYFAKGRHLHVARLYASILPRITDDLIMTLEDDVEPPHDAVRKLGEEFGWASDHPIAAVAAAYAMPQNASWVCAGRGPTGWGAAISWQELPMESLNVSCVGGGCTIWANWAVHGHPVNFWWNRGLGWDGVLCIELRRRGFHVKLHGGVRCEHHLHGRVNGTVGLWNISMANDLPKKTSRMPTHQNGDSWIPSAELGRRIPPYRRTFDFESFINQRHQFFSTCAVKNDATLEIGIPGWLRREDALKLYEMGYFADGDILELGCYQGLSTSILAQAAKDSGDQKTIVSVDREPMYLRSAEKNLLARGLTSYTKLICGHGTNVCQDLVREKKQFSFTFIDHSHRYKSVLEICQLLDLLLIEGGFCLFHDFNDSRNNGPFQKEYGVAQAVSDGLRTDQFRFYGIFGCSALYRKCSVDSDHQSAGAIGEPSVTVQLLPHNGSENEITA